MSECQCRILNGLQFSSGCDLHGEPRTWSLPPEPGPEVKMVRDGDDNLITRWPHYGGGWKLPAPASGVDGYSISNWGEVLAYCKSPIRDATHELKGEE